MSELTNRSLLHKRITNFVNWIKPDPETHDDVFEKANDVRKNIRKKAEEDGLIVESTPEAGSFATHAGLRRHFLGESEVEGQDIDLPFVIKPETIDDPKLNPLLNRFLGYANESYPDTEKEPTKSSVKLEFSDKVNFDLVPMLATENEKEQIIIRKNGEEIKTSVQKHVKFIKSRKSLSEEKKGRVKFNECLRLLKWWRDFQAADSFSLGGDDTPSSFLINLLAAKAYDDISVEETYAETLFKWSGYLAHVINKRKDILFQDFNSPEENDWIKWAVVDPVNPENNVVGKWSNLKIEELGNWFSDSRDDWSRVIRFDNDDENVKSLEYLVKLFGNPFKHHCED